MWDLDITSIIIPSLERISTSYIPQEEQCEMQTIIGANEKRKRNRKQAEAYRRRKGAVTRDEYLSLADK